MISRFVLAKSGLCDADPAVLREIGREHAGRRVDQVVSSFSGGEIDLPDTWQRPYTVAAMQEFLAFPMRWISKHIWQNNNRLFRKHFADVLGQSDRAVLVDTGLYGSIQLFLQNLMPEVNVTSVLLRGVITRILQRIISLRLSEYYQKRTLRPFWIRTRQSCGIGS